MALTIGRTWQWLAHQTDTVSGRLDTFYSCCSQGAVPCILARLAEAGTIVVMSIADSLVTAIQEASTQCQEGAGYLPTACSLTLQMALVAQSGREACTAAQLVGFCLN